MATTPIPLRVSRNLLEVARLRARQQGVDRAAALRQLLREGATEAGGEVRIAGKSRGAHIVPGQKSAARKRRDKK